MSRYKLNIFLPLYLILGTWLSATGRVSWWTFILIFISHMTLVVEWGRRP